MEAKLQSRRATPFDAEVLTELNLELLRDDASGGATTPAKIKARMLDWLSSGEYAAVLFEHEGEVVAYALYREQNASIYLRQFFVAKNRRRLGLGRRALAVLFEEYWPDGKRLSVDVLTSNERALAFWRSVGFLDYCTTLIMAPKQRPTLSPRTSL
ncbi:GNAT family N-acetyltransferase [Chitinimonas arctica]|nr:GNAT family N-acetyltransferase [Chitinimonas arctica]